MQNELYNDMWTYGSSWTKLTISGGVPLPEFSLGFAEGRDKRWLSWSVGGATNAAADTHQLTPGSSILLHEEVDEDPSSANAAARLR